MNIFRKNKVTELTNEEKVAQSKEKVQGALAMFTKIHEDLEEANATLNAVVMEDKTKVDNLNSNISNAVAEIEANIKLQEKIKPFIKEQL